MKTLFFRFLALAAIFTSASAFAALSNAEITELQFHKLNRLVATNKIDAAYINHLGGLTVKQETGGLMINFFQETDSNGMPNAVAIHADFTGKALSFAVVPGTTGRNFTDWNGKVPADIFEKAMEYLADNTTDVRLTPFRDGITSASILQEKDAANGKAALVMVRADERAGVLMIHLDLNGKVLSVEIK